MTSSNSFLTRIGVGSLHRLATAMDRTLRLQEQARRNAARAVTEDRVAALLRAHVDEVVAASASGHSEPRRELTLVGA